MVFLYSKVSIKERAELKDPPAKGSVLYTKTGFVLCILDCSPIIKTITIFLLSLKNPSTENNSYQHQYIKR